MSRVLVTGATGFIGGHLVDALLDRGDDVACLVRNSSRTGRLDGLGVRQVKCDLADADELSRAMENVDVVYHIAGLMAAMSEAQREHVNVDGTRAIAQACAAQRTPPTLLYVSSIAAGGPSTDGKPVCETDPSKPVSHYGRTKRESELVLADLADQIPVTIIRPPMVFGERDPISMAMYKLIKVLRTNLIPGWRHGRRYSLIHVHDLVEAIIRAAETGTRVDASDLNSDNFRQGCYYAADAECLTYGQYGRLVGQALGRRRTFKLGAPDSIMKIVGRLCDVQARLRGKPHPLGSDKVREITAGSWTCLPRLARDDLGFQPIMSLPDRINQTIDWMKRECWL